MVRKEYAPAAWEYQFQEESEWKTLLGTDVAVPELPQTWAVSLDHLRKNHLFPAYMPDLGLNELLDLHKDTDPSQAANAMVGDLEEVFPGLVKREHDRRFLRRHLGLSQQDYALGPYPKGQWILTTDKQRAMGAGVPLTRYLNKKNTTYHEWVPGTDEAGELYHQVLSTLAQTPLSPKSLPSTPTAMEYFLLRRRGMITPVDGYEWTSTKLMSPTTDPDYRSMHDGKAHTGRAFHFNYLCINPQGLLVAEQGAHAYFNQGRAEPDVYEQTPMHVRPLIRHPEDAS